MGRSSIHRFIVCDSGFLLFFLVVFVIVFFFEFIGEVDRVFIGEAVLVFIGEVAAIGDVDLEPGLPLIV